MAEVAFYRGLGLREAVRLAALAWGPDGKRDHQYRVRNAALELAAETLVGQLASLKVVGAFEDLLRLVERECQAKIKWFGTLTAYDTATCIGAKIGLEPERVYLHAGTLTGAKNLGLDTSRGVLEMSEVPREFRHLKPGDIENILCIYKDRWPAATV